MGGFEREQSKRTDMPLNTNFSKATSMSGRMKRCWISAISSPGFMIVLDLGVGVKSSRTQLFFGGLRL